MNMKLHKLFIFLLLVTANAGLTAQTVITHDISIGSLVIAGNSNDNYIITGVTTSNYVEVQTGYQGVITLKNLDITLTGAANSPIAIRGQNKCSNLTPVTNVDIILEGINIVNYKGTSISHSSYAAFQIEQGAQINISENPCYPGSLTATVTNSSSHLYGGAGIGAMNHGYPSGGSFNDATDTVPIIGNCAVKATAGGNIVISSGTVTACGSHGAGIGGAYNTYYNGMIVVYGGTINASANYHAAGLGSGCPTGNGIVTCYTANSAIIALPPAQITATGATAAVGVPAASLGLAGTNYIIYIGDVAKPVVTVHTEDFEPYADIYADLSLNPDIARVFNAIIPQNRFDIRNVKFGQTDANGLFQFHGIFNGNTTFFTDATSSQPSTLGRIYAPETAQLPAGGTVILKRMLMDISVFSFPSNPLPEGYSASHAFTNACGIKIIYDDTVPMTNIVFDIAGGVASDFSTNGIKFYASDSITQILPPTTLSKGDTIYVVIPLTTGKLTGYYTDVFRFLGMQDTTSTGYVRQKLGQHVYFVDTTKNICQGDSILFNGNYYKETGYYYDTLQTVWGCDSIVALHLVIDFFDIDIYDTICKGDSVLFGGKYYGETGIYTDSLKTTISGCDSIVTLNLYVNTSSYTSIFDTICVGEFYTENGFNESTAGIYTQILQNSSICDSIVVLTLCVIPKDTTLIFDTICKGEVYKKNGFNDSLSGIYMQNLQNRYGCDSTVILNLTVNPTPVAAFEANPQETLLGKEIQFTDKTVQDFGILTYWFWDFGDGTDNDLQNPIHLYTALGYMTVFLLVENEFGCKDSTKQEVLILKPLNFPNIFTPIGSDGKPYVFRPLENGGEFEDFEITVYDRWGMIVWNKRCESPNCPDYDDSFWWNGTTKSGKQVSDGVYYWVVYAHYPSSYLKPLVKNGSVTVIR